MGVYWLQTLPQCPIKIDVTKPLLECLAQCPNTNKLCFLVTAGDNESKTPIWNPFYFNENLLIFKNINFCYVYLDYQTKQLNAVQNQFTLFLVSIFSFILLLKKFLQQQSVKL